MFPFPHGFQKTGVPTCETTWTTTPASVKKTTTGTVGWVRYVFVSEFGRVYTSSYDTDIYINYRETYEYGVYEPCTYPWEVKVEHISGTGLEVGVNSPASYFDTWLGVGQIDYRYYTKTITEDSTDSVVFRITFDDKQGNIIAKDITLTMGL